MHESKKRVRYHLGLFNKKLCKILHNATYRLAVSQVRMHGCRDRLSCPRCPSLSAHSRTLLNYAVFSSTKINNETRNSLLSRYCAGYGADSFLCITPSPVQAPLACLHALHVFMRIQRSERCWITQNLKIVQPKAKALAHISTDCDSSKNQWTALLVVPLS